MIEISINFDNEKNLLNLMAGGDDLLKRNRIENVVAPFNLNKIENIYEEEKKNITLLNFLNKSYKGETNIY